MAEEEKSEAAAKIVSRAWSDPEFKARLLSDPAAVFELEGILIPDGVEVRAVEDSTDLRHFVLPAAPADVGELTDEALETIAAAADYVKSVNQPWMMGL